MTPSPPLPVVLTTSNGSGMGHLTRQLVVALTGKGVLDPTVFSMSLAVPVVGTHGVRSEYCPGIDRDWMPRIDWHRYLRDRLVALLHETGAQAMVFDGVTPYPGIVMARRMVPDVQFVWMRRGMWRPGVNDAALERSAAFDLILEPGDLGAAGDVGPTAGRGDAVRVGPITMVDAMPTLSRRDAAAALGIDPDRPAALVTVGGPGDAASPGDVALEILLAAPGWQVCVTRSYIDTRPAPSSPAVTVLRNVYPLARYLAAFDLAVSAVGYNAVHELLPAAVPTVLVPNAAAATDDQVSRAAAVAAEGLALRADAADPGSVADAVRSALDEKVRHRLAAACAALPEQRRGGGAAATVEHLVTSRGQPQAAMRWKKRRAVLDPWFKETAKRALGPVATAAVRRMLGRSVQTQGIDRPLRLALATDGAPQTGVARRLLITSDVTPELLRGPDVVEALIPGASADYMVARRRIIDATYDIVP